MSELLDEAGAEPRSRSYRATITIVVSLLGALVLLLVLTHAAWWGDFATDGAALIDNPWGFATLSEVYVGLVLFSGWVVRRETSALRTGCWVCSFMLLGNLMCCIYVALAAWRARGEPAQFWMGPNR